MQMANGCWPFECTKCKTMQNTQKIDSQGRCFLWLCHAFASNASYEFPIFVIYMSQYNWSLCTSMQMYVRWTNAMFEVIGIFHFFCPFSPSSFMFCIGLCVFIQLSLLFGPIVRRSSLQNEKKMACKHNFELENSDSIRMNKFVQQIRE